MKKSEFPKCWDEERVKRVIAHHEKQSDEEAVAEDEAAYHKESSITACRDGR